jgi:hypothetical protein
MLAVVLLAALALLQGHAEGSCKPAAVAATVPTVQRRALGVARAGSLACNRAEESGPTTIAPRRVLHAVHPIAVGASGFARGPQRPRGVELVATREASRAALLGNDRASPRIASAVTPGVQPAVDDLRRPSIAPGVELDEGIGPRSSVSGRRAGVHPSVFTGSLRIDAVGAGGRARARCEDQDQCKAHHEDGAHSQLKLQARPRGRHGQ